MKDTGEGMRGVVITKMTGSGNDFVFVDGRLYPAATWSPGQIRALCDRRRGVGADGFVVLERGGKPEHVRFHYFNADGGRSDLCGNAALCAVRLASRWEMSPSGRIVLDTDAGAVCGRVREGDCELAELTMPDVPAPVPVPDIALGPDELRIDFWRVGVPHLVVQVADADDPSVRLQVRGRSLRSNPALGEPGANVNFVSRAGSGAWRMRTYERGVEGETLACGTGAVAVAASALWAHGETPPVRVLTSSGETLEVDAQSSQSGALIGPRLCGMGRTVFTAVLADTPAGGRAGGESVFGRPAENPAPSAVGVPPA